MELAEKITNCSVEGVLLKKTLKIRETGEQRNSYTRVDSRNANELYDIDDYEFVPLPNMGKITSILINYKE